MNALSWWDGAIGVFLRAQTPAELGELLARLRRVHAVELELERHGTQGAAEQRQLTDRYVDHVRSELARRSPVD